MGSPTQNRHTFVVRIWCESREIKGAAPEWRGRIERIGSGEHRYFRRLEELGSFIQGFMATDDAERDA